jgi:carbon-monoxide dehydrogenase small subunit
MHQSLIMPLQLNVNGQAMSLDVAPSDLLIEVLREACQLTGTHQGCDTAQCGACTVLVDGAAVKSCNRLAVQCNGQHITTIEGLARNDTELHVMQQSFSLHHGLQCGFCTPGMVMRALAMVNEDVPAEENAVRHALSGNLCRCTGYEGIVKAICEGLTLLRAGANKPNAQELLSR